MSIGKVLSIQSHVVHGYVGNRAAVFPMQLLGFEVDFINSVQFSNHTQYQCFKGQCLNADQLEELLEGLRQNDLLEYSHLLTGYVGNPTFLNKLADLIQELKTKNPNLIYLCDPVMGDNGKLYVSKDLVNIYADRILPLADIITPNIFELEVIYGKKIESNSDLFTAIEYCHSKGVQTVIISSSKPFEASKKDKLVLYASSKAEKDVIRIEFDQLTGTFYGTGDAFAAMFLSWLTKLNNLKSACEHTISAMLHILRRTNESRTRDDELLEIKLIQSKSDIEKPEIIVKGELMAKN
ncbi:pyridoxal kinase [Brachionus plicatilis]|uniref:Pyridoxal kinase n=1 Tax=Brachionus plicatilis TaxID=10195 RepID=A0A3M7QZV7_BRAPC|nr:pyridoxal kinase [Brachionus plicatilis]